MAYKLAVTSSDCKFINQHFGMAQQFLIFEIDDEGDYKFLELRKNDPACSVEGHTEDAMTQTIKLISDCDAILASQIGPGAIDVLIEKGIDPYMAPTFIDEALKELASMRKNTKKE